jgi:head-tail adaptor
MIAAGRLDRRIDLERNVMAEDAAGELTPTWSKVAANLPASYSPIAGTKRFQASQWIARQQVEFRVRYQAALLDLNPLDRVIYPAGGSSPDEIFEIIEASEIGRREGIKIVAARRPDIK